MEKIIHRPKSVMCHICGKQYGTASISIHIVSCTKAWETQESKKPPNQRRPVPQAPQDIPLGTSSKDLEKRNNLAYEAFSTSAMVPCPHCGRTFIEDRLPVHLRSCTAEKPHKSALKKTPVVDEHDGHSTTCHKCLRVLEGEDLEVHLKACGGSHQRTRPSKK